MRARCLALIVVAAGCGDTCEKTQPPRIEAVPAPTPWPTMPATAAEAEALVAKHTKRPIAAPKEIDIVRALDHEGAVGGWRAIFDWLRARAGTGDAWVLVGTHHDSAAPIMAFRRLLDPDAPLAWTRVVIEQLRADGEWKGLDVEAQRGDSSDLSAFGHGSDVAFERLLAAQEANDYAAWKYGYTRVVLDVAGAARSRLSACDAPREVADRFPEASRLRLRELHCALSLERDLRPGPRRIAMLWGEAHVRPEGFPRFVAPEARVVTIRIPRETPAPVVDPVLLPDGDDAVLLIPSDSRNELSDHVREPDASLVPHRVRVTGRGEIRVGGRAVGDALAAGTHPFTLWAGGKLRAIGVLEMPKDGALDIRIEDPPPIVTITTRHKTTHDAATAK